MTYMRVKKIERIILKNELNDLLRGKSIIISNFRHIGKNYELKGYLKEIKKKL